MGTAQCANKQAQRFLYCQHVRHPWESQKLIRADIMRKAYRQQIKERHCVSSAQANGRIFWRICSPSTTKLTIATVADPWIHPALEVPFVVETNYLVLQLSVSLTWAVLVHDIFDPTYKMGEHLHPILALPPRSPHWGHWRLSHRHEPYSHGLRTYFFK